MIKIMGDVPRNIIAFHAEGRVIEEDYKNVVIPAVEVVIKQKHPLNYVMFLDTPLSRITMHALLQDALLAIKKIHIWRRAAIVSDSRLAKATTALFGLFATGKFKSFRKSDLDKAINWAAG